MNQLRPLVWLATLLAAFALGCNSGRLKTYEVEGQVVFKDGSPVKVGIVETKALGKSVQATGSINKDGSFRLTTYRENDGAIAGQHRVVVIQMIPVEDIPNYRPSTMGVVHRKHASYNTSELTMSVEPGGPNKIRLVVAGADPIGKNDKDHGHDEIPTDPNGSPDPGE
ncbi:MAG: hypothetical protein LW720_13835 [Pirellula sp.]|nr:hypothetical protein [Pirellula sp.]